jgi:hypothetical protein
MVYVDGTYFLMFSTGIWDSTSYSETYATCAGPTGPCAQFQQTPILSSYGSAAGPGGGSLFQDASGAWMIDYSAWLPGCTDYSCGGARRMFVAPATLLPPGLASPVTGMAATPDGDGYWLVDAEGAVSSHGSAVGYGSMAGQHLNAPINHIVATPDGRGYWLVASDGGIFSFGDAAFYGSMGGQHLNAPVVDIAPTRDGGGYWLVAADGGIFSFGDAAFHGSMGGQHLNRPVVGISPDDATGGYWEVATDGGVFAFDAPFFGSTGNLVLNQPVNGMAASPDGGGYRFVASDGGIFAFGDAPFEGSMGATPLNAPVVGMATDPVGGGYWLVAADGGVFSFEAPFRRSGLTGRNGRGPVSLSREVSPRRSARGRRSGRCRWPDRLDSGRGFPSCSAAAAAPARDGRSRRGPASVPSRGDPERQAADRGSACLATLRW